MKIVFIALFAFINAHAEIQCNWIFSNIDDHNLKEITEAKLLKSDRNGVEILIKGVSSSDFSKFDDIALKRTLLEANFSGMPGVNADEVIELRFQALKKASDNKLSIDNEWNLPTLETFEFEYILKLKAPLWAPGSSKSSKTLRFPTSKRGVYELKLATRMTEVGEVWTVADLQYSDEIIKFSGVHAKKIAELLFGHGNKMPGGIPGGGWPHMPNPGKIPLPKEIPPMPKLPGSNNPFPPTPFPGLPSYSGELTYYATPSKSQHLTFKNSRRSLPGGNPFGGGIELQGFAKEYILPLIHEQIGIYNNEMKLQITCQVPNQLNKLTEISCTISKRRSIF